MSTADLDKIDRAILKALAADGRITITDLSRKIGLSKTPCQARIKRLENSKYILGYRAMLSPKRLGLDHIAFVQVTLSDTRAKALDAFNAAVRDTPEIEQCHMIAGSFDYLLEPFGVVFGACRLDRGLRLLGHLNFSGVGLGMWGYETQAGKRL